MSFTTLPAVEVPPPVHQVEHTVSLPPGLPPTDQTAPKVVVTQEQIDFLVSQAGAIWPTIKGYWPAIILFLGLAGKAGDMISRAVYPPVTTSVEVVAPAQPIQKTPSVDPKRLDDLEKTIKDADAKLKATIINQQEQNKIIGGLQKTIGDNIK